MGLSRLSKQCEKCQFKDTCNNKRMEALAYLPEPPYANQATQSSTDAVAMPVARETVERYAYGQKFVMYKDDLEKELYGALYEDLYKSLCVTESMLKGEYK